MVWRPSHSGFGPVNVNGITPFPCLAESWALKRTNECFKSGNWFGDSKDTWGFVRNIKRLGAEELVA